jgi:hypothetical protein
LKQPGKAYRQLLSELEKKLHSTWSELIPKMYKALRKDGFDPVEAKEQLMKNLVDTGLCHENMIYRNIPNIAKPLHDSIIRAYESRSTKMVEFAPLKPEIQTIIKTLEENPAITRAVLK